MLKLYKINNCSDTLPEHKKQRHPSAAFCYPSLVASSYWSLWMLQESGCVWQNCDSGGGGLRCQPWQW